MKFYFEAIYQLKAFHMASQTLSQLPTTKFNPANVEEEISASCIIPWEGLKLTKIYFQRTRTNIRRQ